MDTITIFEFEFDGRRVKIRVGIFFLWVVAILVFAVLIVTAIVFQPQGQPTDGIMLSTQEVSTVSENPQYKDVKIIPAPTLSVCGPANIMFLVGGGYVSYYNPVADAAGESCPIQMLVNGVQTNNRFAPLTGDAKIQAFDEDGELIVEALVQNGVLSYTFGKGQSTSTPTQTPSVIYVQQEPPQRDRDYSIGCQLYRFFLFGMTPGDSSDKCN